MAGLHLTGLRMDIVSIIRVVPPENNQKAIAPCAQARFSSNGPRPRLKTHRSLKPCFGHPKPQLALSPTVVKRRV